MALSEEILETPRFPENISYGSTGGPGYSTDVVTVSSGAESRNINWTESRHTYNAAFGIRDESYITALVNFFHTVKGKAYGFRYKDWSDYTSSDSTTISATDQYLGTGDSEDIGVTGTTQFQLIKAYSAGVLNTGRIIHKPVNGTVVVARDGIIENASNYVLSTINGTINFFTGHIPLTGEVITAGFEFDVPCRFDTDTLSINLEMYQHGSTDVPLVELRI